MKAILFFLFIVSCSILNAQPKVDVQKQMRESKKEVYKLLDDFDNQIAEAIRNKEDQATIDELKKQRAALMKVLNLVDSAASMGAKRPAANYIAKDNLPKFVSPIVPISLKQPIVAPTKAQAKDSLLWYVGRKLNDSILITPENSVVLYSPRRNMVVVRTDHRMDSVTINLVRSLSQWTQWNVKYIETFAAEKNSYFDYPQIESEIAEFDQIEQRYTDLVRNTIALPTQTDIRAYTRINFQKQTGGSSVGYDDGLRALHLQLKYLMEEDPPINVSQPPYDCYQCSDPAPAIDVNDAWQGGFVEYELRLLFAMKMIKTYMAFNNISTAASGIPTLQQDLTAAVRKAFDRWDRKVDILETYCKATPGRMSSIIINLLLLQNQKKLYTGIVDNSYSSRAKNLLSGYKDIIAADWDTYMARKLYSSALNTCIPSLFERHYLTLNGTSTNFAADLRAKVKSFNRFVLRIELKFEVEELGADNQLMMLVDGEAITSEKIYVSLGRFNNRCNYQLYLTNTDYNGNDENAFHIPMTVLLATKYMHYYNPVRIVTLRYSGPRDLLMIFPYTSLGLNTVNFHPTDVTPTDTVIFDLLRYKEANLTRYSPGPAEYSADYLAYLNKMFTASEKIKDEITPFVKEMSDMMLMQNVFAIDPITRLRHRQRVYAKLDKLWADFTMNSKQKYHQQMLARVAQFPNTFVPVASRLGHSILLEKTQPLANTEFERNHVLKSGQIKIKVTHDPQ